MKPLLILSCSVTKSHFKEFLLLRYSAELFHDCQWYLSCDEYCYDILSKDFDCHCENTEMQNGKVFGNEEEIFNFYKVIDGKFAAAKRAIADHGRVLMVDSDIIFTAPLRYESSLQEEDAILSPHYQWNTEMDKAWGLYNVGFVYIRNIDFLNAWEEETKSGKYEFEQVPIEIVTRTNKFLLNAFPIGENMGWWRFNNPRSIHRYQSFAKIGDYITFDGNVVGSFHFHTFVSCRHSETFKEIVFGQIFPQTEYGRKILEKYEELKSW